MKIVVDREKCTGLGVCESLAPDHFAVDDDGGLVLLDDTVNGADLSDVETAVASCPTSALSISR